MSESSASSKPCAKCGAGLPSESTGGLCPRCMLSQALNEPSDSEISKPTVPVSSPRKSWEPPSAEELGRLLPQYRIERLLGRGGMGAVYQGRQVSLDRVVAIKILSNDLEEADASFAERFKNEARALGKLSHPGIVAVHEFGEAANGLLYIVMEFIEGTDVARMIAAQGRLHSEHAMAITAHVCDALAYAHERGIIHRDIKPANIMVGYDGVVKVADFGLAKVSASGGETLGLTQSGMAMGTLHFMAPEALMLGSAVDHRADIYAVGVMLYQMLTGKLPHGMFELPSIRVQGLDPRYDGIIARAMREDRDLRYQSARQMRHDLDGILTQPVQRVEPEAAQSIPAALPTEVRPRRSPAGQPYRPPQHSVPVPVKKKSSAGLVLLTLGLLAAIGAAMFFLGGQRSAPSGVTAPEDSGQAVSTAATTALTSATKDAPFVNTLGMKFVPVPGTKVLFGVWHVRVEDYAEYAKAQESAGKKVDGAWKTQNRDGVPASRELDHPVVGVNWEDAQTFCQWLTEKETAEGKLPKGLKYRLPSDEEWSWAVGLPSELGGTPAEKSGKNNLDFPWGKVWPPTKKVGNYADETYHAKFPKDPQDKEKDAPWMKEYSDGYATTSPVGSFPADAYGLYDMGGNVWQWCEDWFDKDQKQRVLRGASWVYGDRGRLLSSYRGHDTPGNRYYDNGFRCVLGESAPGVAPGVAATPPSPSATPTAPPLSPKSGNEIATATKEAPFTNTLGMKFVPVPGTKVLMCIHETRRQDYAAYAGQTPAVDGLWKNTTEEGIPVSDKDDHPVVSVNWDDVQAFCGWLSKKEGKVYRLPTDQEWSFAVGIGDDEIRNAETTPEMLNGKVAVFPWGTGLPPPKGAGNYADITLNQTTGNHRFIPDYTDGFATTAPVMSFTPNKLGLYDLGGNVWEWVEDWWNVDQKQRVCRGASFGPHGAQVYSSARYASWPHLRRSMFGFRLVTEVPGTDSTSAVPVKNQPLNASVSQTSAATKDKPFTNTLGMKFVPVPITGGSTDKQRVLFSIWETRVQDYEVFVKETKCVWHKPRFQSDFVPGPTDPVTAVNWDDATAFCAWLTERERKAGQLPDTESYRLPSDHEWSCAVGIGSREDAAQPPSKKNRQIADVFPWGTNWPPPEGLENLAGEELQPLLDGGLHPYIKQVIPGYRDSFTELAPVGSFKANALGLHDLGGNVSEWCEDWLDATRKHRVLRGATWLNHERSAPWASSRPSNHPVDSHFNNYGFRVVLAPVVASEGRAAGPPAAASGPSVMNPPSTALGGPNGLSATTNDKPFTNTLGMKFVPVPGTNILMCVHETRRQDYRIYADAVPGTDATWKAPVVDGKPLVQGEGHPVIHVSLEDATAFCKWLGNKDGHNYRLPSDHEWNLAVAIGLENPHEISPTELHTRIKDAYPWPTPALAGNQLRSDQNKEAHYAAQTEGFKHGNYRGNTDGYEGTAPVMSFLPNHLGIYDLGGNVWEWCTAPPNASGNTQPLRGCGFRNYSWGIVADSRTHINRDARIAPQPDGSLRDFGFRCVVELPAP